MISHTVKTSLLWKTLFSQILETCYTGWWHLENVLEKINVHMERFTCFIFERDVWKWGKHITVNFLQVIHRFCLKKQYHSKFSGINHSTVYHKSEKRKIQLWSLFLPYLPYLPLSYILGVADRKFPMWEIARARIVTDKETEISTVSCLAALQCC
jgi:hypothetical protein